MKKNIWYAVQENALDNSWDGEGSASLEEAKDIARRMGSEARIAVIDVDDEFCLDVIEQEDF